MQPQGVPMAFGGLFLLLWLGMMGVGVVSWILVLIAMWRGMKAHESIAESARYLVDLMQSRRPGA